MMSAGACRAAAVPVVAVVALNAGTETTDFLVPYGVLATSGAVDIHAVSMVAGRSRPALNVELDETIAGSIAAHPAGADAHRAAVHDPADAHLLGWLRQQAKAGATIVAIATASGRWRPPDCSMENAPPVTGIRWTACSRPT
jgi:putative intracellular protease/amidase